jgi:hypothetical protein
MKKALKEVISAIENGKKVEDGRGVVYKQDFGENFLEYLKKSLENTDFDITMPIPLTSEILEKCGFVMLHHLGKLQPTLQIDESLEFHWAEDTLFVTYSEDNYDENIELGGFTIERPLRHIKHLHQLQNLYFALTNTELTYKP